MYIHEINACKNIQYFDSIKWKMLLDQSLPKLSNKLHIFYYLGNSLNSTSRQGILNKTPQNRLISTLVFAVFASISIFFVNLSEAQTIEKTIDVPDYLIEGQIEAIQENYELSKYKTELRANTNNPVKENDETPPTVSITTSSSSIVEGNSFEVEITAIPAPTIGRKLAIDLTVEETGMGTGYFKNYSPQSIFISNSGNSVATTIVTISTNLDHFDEDDGEITVSINDSMNYFVAASPRNSVAVEVTDDDIAPTISINGQTNISEGNDTSANVEVSFEVTLSAESYKEIRIYYATGVNGTATRTSNHLVNPGDYIIKSGILTFAGKTDNTAGVTSQQITIAIIGDKIDEENEIFQIILTNADHAILPAEFESTNVIIIDDDNEPVLSIDSVAITEGNSGEKDLDFTLTLNAMSQKEITVDYKTISGTATAGEDFTAIDTTKLIIPVLTSSTQISVKVRGDTTPEANETFTLQLTNAKNTILLDDKNVGFGTIFSDDIPAFGITNASGNENDGVVKFIITLTPVSNQRTKVLFSTPENSADSGVIAVDFYTLYRELTFEVGDDIKQVEVPLINDDLDENEEEFSVNLTNPSGGAVLAIGNSSAKGIIIDDDPITRIFIEDVKIIEGNEGNSTALFPVTVNSISGRDIKVKYYTPVSIAYGLASNSDFLAITNGVLEIPAGTKRSFISVVVIGDDAFEPDERVTVILNDPISAEISKVVGIGIILNDDDPAIPHIDSIVGKQAEYFEGQIVVFEISATLPSESENIVKVPINFNLKGDFLNWRVPKYFPLNAQTTEILVHTHDDSVDEPDGSITATIEKENGVFTINPLQSSFKVGILDNDNETSEQPNISIATSAVNEILTAISTEIPTQQTGEVSSNQKPIIFVNAISAKIEEGAFAEFEIFSRRTIDRKLTVKFKLDQVGNFLIDKLPSKINLTQTEKFARVKIETHDDTFAEDDGQITLTLTNQINYLVGTPNHATVFVSDYADRLKRKSEILEASKNVFPRFLDSVGAHATETTSKRVHNAFSKTNSTITFEFDGKENLIDLLTAGGEAINTDSMSLYSIFKNSSFTIDLFPEEHTTSPATIWGVSDQRDLTSKGTADSNSLSGDIYTGQIGFDTKFGKNFLTGVALSSIQSEIKYVSALKDELIFRSSYSVLNPYFGWNSSNKNTQISGLVGYGLGHTKIGQDYYGTESLNNELYTLGFSGKHLLYSSESIFQNRTIEIGIIGNSWMASQHMDDKTNKIDDLDINANHFRIATIGSYEFILEPESLLKSTASIGFRRDHKDQFSVIGIELGSGLSYSSTFGLTFSGSTSTLIAKYNEINKWGMMGNILYDFARDSLGTLLKVSPSIGNIQDSKTDTLWNNNNLGETRDFGLYKNGIEIDSEFGFGFEIFEGLGRLTPYSRIDFSNF